MEHQIADLRVRSSNLPGLEKKTCRVVTDRAFLCFGETNHRLSETGLRTLFRPSWAFRKQLGHNPPFAR